MDLKSAHFDKFSYLLMDNPTRLNELYLCYCPTRNPCNCTQLKRQAQEANQLLEIYLQRRKRFMTELRAKLDQSKDGPERIKM